MTTSWVVMLTSMCVVAFAGTAFLGGGSDHQLTARFSNAGGLVPGNVVRIGGVVAGSVQSVTLARSGTSTPEADVLMTVDGAHWPLHQGTTAQIRPKGVLGEMYVELDPGSERAPSLGGDPVLGLASTVSQVTLDELQNVFQPDARSALRTQLQQGVVALGTGGAGNLNGTLQYANPLTANVDPLTAVLAARTPQLDRLNTEFDTITADLAREDSSLAGLVSSADTTLGALASREAALQGTLVHAGGTLGSLDQGLQGEQANLESIFNEAPAALQHTQDAATALTPLITAVNPHIADLDILLNELLTATGFPAHQGAVPTAPLMDTLRADATLASGPTAQSCGGEPTQNACAGAGR